MTSRVVNSFALLGDEEEDDVTVLVDHFAKKVGVAEAVSAKKTKKNEPQDSQQLPSEQEKETGREGQGRGSERSGVGKKDVQFSNQQANGNRRKYSEGSNLNGYDNRRRGGYNNANRGRGGYDNCGRGGHDNRGHDGYDNAHRGRGRGHEGNRGRGRGRVSNETVSVNVKEGNRKTKEIDPDGWQYVGNSHLRGKVNKASNNDENARAEQLDINAEVKENVDSADAVVKVESDIAVSEGDAAAAVSVVPTPVKAEERTPEGSVKSEGRAKADKPFKKFEKEDENLMTLEEYQKVFAEKRKALEALKNEEMKVAADQEFEAMQILAKKKEEALQKPELTNLKKKDGLEKDEKSRKTVSINEFLKPADGEKFFYRRPGRGRVHGGVRGDLKNGDRTKQGGGSRNRDPSQQGALRNRDRAQQGGLSSVNRAERGEFKSKDGADQEQQGGIVAEDKPVIQIQDPSQFPVLKGTAPAV